MILGQNMLLISTLCCRARTRMIQDDFLMNLTGFVKSEAWWNDA